MRAITKGREPASLTAHRKTPYASYKNYAPKDDLRHCLVTEQRGLCAYCMARIREDAKSMKIEHWQSQTHFPAEQLTYRNLLGGCLGGQGQPGHLQHCDTKKGDRELPWNPAEAAHHIETRLKYELDGTIRANEPVFDRQLNEVLNLNLPLIRNNRKGVLTALAIWWKAVKPQNPARIQREIDERTNGAELAPYSQVAIWWLRQRLLKT